MPEKSLCIYMDKSNAKEWYDPSAVVFVCLAEKMTIADKAFQDKFGKDPTKMNNNIVVMCGSSFSSIELEQLGKLIQFVEV